MTRARNFARNPTVNALGAVGAARIGSLAVAFACTVITIRLIVSGHGSETYGAVSLVASLVALVPFADLGLGIAITNLTVEVRAGAYSGRLRLGFSATFWTLTGMGLLLIAAALVVSLFDAWRPLLGEAAGLLGEPNSFMPIYVSLFALWLVGGPGFRVLFGQGKSALVMLLQGLNAPITLFLTYVALNLDWPVFALALFPLCSTIFVAAIGWLIASRELNAAASLRFVLWPWQISRRYYSKFFRIGLSGVALVIGSALLLQSDRLILAQVGSPSDLATFAVAIPLFAAVQSVLGAIGSYLWPHYTVLRLAGGLTIEMVKRQTIIFIGIGCVMAIAVGAAYPGYLWAVGQDGNGTGSLILAICLLILVQSASLPASSVLSTPWLLRIQGRLSLTCAIVKVAGALALAPWLGAAGVVAATAATIGLVQLPVLFLVASRALRDGNFAGDIVSRDPTRVRAGASGGAS